MKSIANFFLGLITALIVSIFLGAFQDFLGFMMISIVCTMGVTLVAWIPALTLLGAITRYFIKAIVRAFKKGDDFEGKSSPARVAETTPEKSHINKKNVAAVVGYISSAKATGTMTDAVIRTKLKGAGWSEEIIEEGFKKVESLGL